MVESWPNNFGNRAILGALANGGDLKCRYLELKKAVEIGISEARKLKIEAVSDSALSVLNPDQDLGARTATLAESRKEQLSD